MVNNKKTLTLSIFEAGSYNAFYIATQGFIFTTLAIYFNSSPFFISIMFSFPIIAQMFQIFSSQITKMYGSRKRSLVINAFISRSLFVVLPFLIYFEVKNPYILLIMIILFSLFGTFVGNTWTVLMKEVVPIERRGRYFSLRNIFSSITGMVMTFVYSKFLDSPNLKMGLLWVSIFMAVFSLLSAFLLMKHEFPEGGDKIPKVNISISKPFKDKSFKDYLIFIFIWNLAIEFSRPYFSYYEVGILNINPTYLGYMSILNSIIAIMVYLFFGTMADKFGSKNVLTLGIFISTFSPLMYFLMGLNNYKSVLFMNAILSAFAWSAINIAIFNLLLELSKEPSESYIAANALVGGIAAIIASLIGGSLGNYLKNIQINFLGDSYYGIQLIFIIGFIMRIIAVMFLSNVEAVQRPMKYKEVFSFEGVLSKRREINMPFEWFRRTKKVSKPINETMSDETQEITNSQDVPQLEASSETPKEDIGESIEKS